MSKETKTITKYTITEEVIHCSIHGLGIILSIAALAILVAFSVPDPWKIVSSAIFGFSMIVLYTSSTIYHALTNENARSILKKFDHISIYYLIAGTYTPFVLVNLRGAVGWTIFGIIWGLAIIGTILKIILPCDGKKYWSVGLYLIMGWLIIFASKSLFLSMNKLLQEIHGNKGKLREAFAQYIIDNLVVEEEGMFSNKILPLKYKK